MPDTPKSKIFEIQDISHTGMQLSLKYGEHKFLKDSPISGILHWRNSSLRISGKVKWAKESKIGVAFDINTQTKEHIGQFLSVDNIVSNMIPVHQNKDLFSGWPTNLKY